MLECRLLAVPSRPIVGNAVALLDHLDDAPGHGIHCIVGLHGHSCSGECYWYNNGIDGNLAMQRLPFLLLFGKLDDALLSPKQCMLSTE